MEDFEITFVAQGIWIGFVKVPDIQSIQEARRLLDNLTDELIKKELNVSTPLK